MFFPRIRKTRFSIFPFAKTSTRGARRKLYFAPCSAALFRCRIERETKGKGSESANLWVILYPLPPPPYVSFCVSLLRYPTSFVRHFKDSKRSNYVTKTRLCYIRVVHSVLLYLMADATSDTFFYFFLIFFPTPSSSECRLI